MVAFGKISAILVLVTLNPKDFLTTVKLFQYFAIVAKTTRAEWVQPTYQEALEMYRTRSEGQWGHPVGLRAAANWDLCPELALPSGVAGTACQGATCMVVCEDGKVAVGKRRIKCRWTRKKGFFWKAVSLIFIKNIFLKLLEHFRENSDFTRMQGLRT